MTTGYNEVSPDEGVTPRHALVLCTRNRPALVAQCLDAVLQSTRVPDEILIVDSSDGEETMKTVASLVPSKLHYLRSPPGLTHQRNVGLAALSSSVRVVHFLDDDSLVSPGYFEGILSAFDRHPGSVGVGGFVPGTDYSNSLQRRILRRYLQMFRLMAPPGKLSRAACGTALTVAPVSDVQVEWLSGCAMSFLSRPARELGFDEKLKGYSLGEDMEFSVRISRTGSIWIASNAQMQHLATPINRYGQRRMAESSVVNRHHFVGTHPERFSRVAFWASVVGASGLGVASMVRGQGRETLAGIVVGLGVIRAERKRKRSP